MNSRALLGAIELVALVLLAATWLTAAVALTRSRERRRYLLSLLDGLDRRLLREITQSPSEPTEAGGT